ncbi:MAG: sugar phosphate isomerase/epimerase [Candidatus Sumerlaeota bacterium]|nr:sugar phosphate isomerase/epimerase [Candidatus Sumerlaeota bacterium]
MDESTNDKSPLAMSRREVLAGAAAMTAAAALSGCGSLVAQSSSQIYSSSTTAPSASAAAPQSVKGATGMKIGFHTDAFNTSYQSFEACLKWAQKNNVRKIECGLIDGVSWIHGLGYQPHVAMYEDPALLKKKMDGYGVSFSQVDAAYPLSNEDGPLRGVPYVMNAIRWAKLIGCPCVDTTDGLHKPERLNDPAALDHMKRQYEQIIEVAEAYQIIINIEPHGYFTTKPDMMAKMLDFCQSPCLRMNMDTGNTFIAGQDPVEFLKRFIQRVSHVHVKDVSESLAAATRGAQTGIAVSQCAIGDGVNAGNIRKCLELLRDHGYTGTLSMECEGQGGPMIEKSLAWLRKTLKELNIPTD